jgi:outer membrane protein TolC
LTKNQVDAALASLEVTRAGEETLRQTIRLEVEQAFANLQAT